MITPSQALHRCIEHREIFHDEMLHLMRMLMRGEMSPAIAAALLMGLRVKKETVGEITAAATVMREFATPVKIANPQDMVDMCGTGGDGSNTFNISTTAMPQACRSQNTAGAALRRPPAVLMCLRHWVLI